MILNLLENLIMGKGKGMGLRYFKVSFNFFVAIKIAVCLKTTVDN